VGDGKGRERERERERERKRGGKKKKKKKVVCLFVQPVVTIAIQIFLSRAIRSH